MLTSALGDSDDLVSSTAALALARRQREEVLDLARDRLEYDDLAVAGLSFEIISYFEDGIATEIEKELNCELPDKQPYALQGLVPLIQRGNDRAWALLKKAIGSRFPEVRTKALEIAIELGGGERAEALNIAVNASDPDLRCVALREMALGDDAEDYIDTLKLALNDVNLKVLFTASWSLLKLRDPAPVEYLRAVLADQRVSIRDKIVAARILARMGAPDGADPMYDIIDAVNMAEDIKLEAAEVLGEYEDKIGMGYLGEAIKPNRPPEVRRKALSMLGLMGDRRAGVLLLEMTKDADESIAVRAAYALTALGDARGIGRLRRLLNSDSVEVRTLAAMGIVTGGDITDIIGEEGYR
jgi:HEAT repeat protein